MKARTASHRVPLPQGSFGRSLLLLALCLAATAAQAAIWSVPGEHATIQAAIDAAQAGDTIDVAAGVFAENLTFKAGVQLIGAGRDKTIVRASAKKGPVLNVENCESGSVSAIAFEHVDRDERKPDDQGRPSAIRLISSAVRVSDCRVSNAAAKGIVIGSGASIVENCLIERPFWHGVLVTDAGASATLRHNAIRESGASGIAFLNGASGLAEANRCESNVWHGIYVSGANSAPTLRGNECLNNQRSGISFEEGARGRAGENACHANAYNGIFASGAGTSPLLQANRCFENKSSGIYIESGARPSVVANLCEKNNATGIVVSGLNAAPALRRNRCVKNRSSGIYFEKGGGGLAEANICEENVWTGIVVDGSGTGPALRENQCNRNGYAGIAYKAGATGVAEGNVCRDNEQKAISIAGKGTTPVLRNNETTPDRQIAREDVEPLIAQSRFDDLEALAQRLRKEKARYRNTEWQISGFYEYFESVGHGIKPEARDDITLLVKRWGEAKPASLTQKIAMARLLIAYGWTERGGGWARSVTEEGWKGFGENLQNAFEKLKEAERQQEKDPELYVCLITIGMGRGSSREQMDEWLNKGAAIEPLYYPLYYARAASLLPRWGGAPGELEEFAARSADSVRNIEGDALYARIVLSVSRYVGMSELRDVHEFDWSRVEKGFRDAMRHYPDSKKTLMNQLGWFACWNMKRETARAVFAELGGDTMESYWGDAARMARWKDWADGISVVFPGGTPLHEAARQDDVVAARKLLEAGADPNVRDIDGETPLRWAVKHDGGHVMALLLDHGADVNAADEDGATPLATAVLYDKDDAANQLLDAGANPDAISADGYTPLNVALYNNKVDLARTLLEHGADPNSTIKNGYTPLIMAAREPKLAGLLPLLLEKGADVNRAGPENWTPLMSAAYRGAPDAVRLLIQRGANVNFVQPQESGTSAIHVAVNENRLDILQILAEAKDFNPNIAGPKGRTPLHVAARRGQTDFARFLVQKGANPDLADSSGLTPVKMAENYDHRDIVELLRAHSAAASSPADPGSLPASGPSIRRAPRASSTLPSAALGAGPE